MGSSATGSVPWPQVKMFPPPPPAPPPPPWICPPPPHPATPSNTAPVRPVPLSLRKSRRLIRMVFFRAKMCSLLPLLMECLLEGTVTPALPRRHLEERAARLLAAAQPVGRVVCLPGGL